MNPELEGFIQDLTIAVLTTVVLLALAVWSGVRRKRSAHYALVTLTFIALGIAIFVARRLSPYMSYDETGLWIQRIHFTFVGVTVLLVPVVVVSGAKLGKALMLADRGEEGHDAARHRASHRKVAWWTVAVLVITCVLGTAMTVAGLPA